MAMPISWTPDRRFSRVPSCWIDCELGRPRRHPLEVLGGPDRDAGLGRQGGHGLEVVVGPGVRLVVVDVEQAEQLGAVEQRRRADGVEALLDDRGTDALAARVVAVVDGEERTALRRRPRPGSDIGREVADAREVGRRQAAADLGDGAAVGALEEDRAAVGLEQDHGVVDEAGEDPVEVEAAADVARDPVERLGPMELVGDLLRAGARPRRSCRWRWRRPRRPRRRAARATTVVSATRWSTPHGPPSAGMTTASSGRPPGRIGSGAPVPRLRSARGRGPSVGSSGHAAAASAAPRTPNVCGRSTSRCGAASVGASRRRAGPGGRRGAPRAPRGGGRRRRGPGPPRGRGRRRGRRPRSPGG